MPINNNVGCLNAYDRASVIPVEFQGGISDPVNLQHAVHCLAFECLRAWMRMSVAFYNAIPEPEPWNTVYAETTSLALIEARKNPMSATQIGLLTVSDIETAANLGMNYFEHGYVQITSNIDPSAKRNFERDSGISAN